MKRKLFAILTCALLLGATSALADSKITGFYRLQGIVMSEDGLTDSNTISGYDQRLRVKWDNMINDAVSVTWYGEVDMPWGMNGKEAAKDTPTADTHSHGGGGKLGADGVNVETKNVYATIKVASVTAKIGMQTYIDNTGAFAYFAEDVSGLNFTTAFDKVTLGLLVAKATEGDVKRTDDENIYALQAGFAASETMKFTAGLWWDNVQASGGTADDTKDVYTATVSANMKFGGVGVDGFVAYQTGNNSGDQDVNALAASVAAAMKAGPADLALRVIYYGADDDAEDDMAFEQRAGELEYMGEGQTIFLTDANKMNIMAFTDRYALKDAAYAGYGLFAAVLKGSTTVSNFGIKGSVGYYMALDDSRNDEATASREGTDLGVEIDASVSYKVADNATLQLRGAYAMLGSFYDNATGDDPEDLYRAVCQLDVTF